MTVEDGMARIEDDRIVITVALSNIQLIANGAWASGGIEPIRIPDPKAFAEEMCHAMNEEDEDGTTPVHRFFDDMMSQAFENGAGEEMTEEEAEEMAASFQKSPQKD